MTNDWRNARIEEAERRYPDIEANPETFPTGWSREQERNAFIAGAVFEKALGEATVTPTDADEVISEQEALRIAELDARQAAYRQDCTDWFVDHEQEPGITTNAFFRGWDAAVDGGFRRTEVPEPSNEGDEFAQDECDGSGTCPARRHIHGCYTRHRADQCDSPDEYGHLSAEPQGEPSDAQIRAAAREYHERGNGEGSFDRIADHVRTSLLFRMGCALRAAGGVR